MNRNKFKVLLCCYTMGIAGCNKIGNPSHMDGGGDRKDDKKQEAEASFSVVQSSSNVVALQRSGTEYNKILQDSLSALKSVADTAEQVAISKKEAAERAIKAAEDAKIAADTARKIADGEEKNSPELGDTGTEYNKILQDSLSALKSVADTAEQVAISKKEGAERAIKAAEDAKIAADTARKTSDYAEKNTPELGGGDASTLTGIRHNTEDDREKGARLELGPGGDSL